MRLFISYSDASEDIIKDWLEEVKEAFPKAEVFADPLTLSIGCHIGPGAIAIATCVYKKENDDATPLVVS